MNTKASNSPPKLAPRGKPRTPSLRMHRATGQGYVELDGRRHYLGRYGLPETEKRYHRMLAEWFAHGRRLPVPPEDITVAELADRYLEHAEAYYRKPDGSPTSSLGSIKSVLKTLLALYADIPAAQFGPLALRTLRQRWVNANLTTTTINSHVGEVRMMFKWAASNELIPVTAYQALTALPGLRRGRGVGRDPEPRQVVPQEHVDAVLPLLTKPLQAVVRLQLLCGARPSELLTLKRRDIDTSGAVWVAIIREHKQAHRGMERRLFFGERGKAVLRPFLLRAEDDYLFSPQEGFRDLRAEGATQRRRDDQPDTPRETDRQMGECYTHSSYRRAVHRACVEAGVPPWTPYQLRHTCATNIEATADLETARVILGHADLDTTAIYLHKDHKAAAAFALAHG